MASKSDEFKLFGATLYEGRLYHPGDEGKLSDEAREAMQLKRTGQGGGRPMPRREVSSGQQFAQHPMDSGGPDPAESEGAGEAPAKKRGKRASG